jgi:hypothetical protein
MRLWNALLSRINGTCGRTGDLLSAYVDGVLANAERRAVAVHLRECDSCSRRHAALTATRGMLRHLPPKNPPSDLSLRLGEIARRESALQRARVHGSRALQFAIDGARMRFRNLMQPLAIPLAGGVASSLVLFAMLAPSYPGVARASIDDVPTAFYQEPSVKSIAPFGLSNDEVIVELTLDETGQVIDYHLPDEASPELRREVENTLLFARFTPALAFGQPTTGRLRISFRRSHIDVKG